MLWVGPALRRRARPDERPRQSPVLGTGQRGPSERRSAGCDLSAPSAQGRPHGAGGPWPRRRCRSVRRGPAGLPPERGHQPASALGCVAEEADPPGLPQECRSPPFSDELWSAWRNQRQCFSHCPGTSERASLPVPSACDSQGGAAPLQPLLVRTSMPAMGTFSASCRYAG